MLTKDITGFSHALLLVLGRFRFPILDKRIGIENRLSNVDFLFQLLGGEIMILSGVIVTTCVNAIYFTHVTNGAAEIAIYIRLPPNMRSGGSAYTAME